MQTYGLKVGDRVKLSQNAGTHPQGFISKYGTRKEPIYKDTWEDDLEIQGFEFIDGATYIKIITGSYLIATEVEKIKEKSIEDAVVGDIVWHIGNSQLYKITWTSGGYFKAESGDFCGSGNLILGLCRFATPEEISKYKSVKSVEDVKVGDWITIVNSGKNWNSHMSKCAGNTYKVTMVEDYYGLRVRFKGDGGWDWTIKDGHFRYATKEEIAKLNQVVIKFDTIDLTIVKGSGKATCAEGIIILKDVEEILDSIQYSGKKLLGYAVEFTAPDDTIVHIGCQKDTLAKVKEIYKAMRG